MPTQDEIAPGTDALSEESAMKRAHHIGFEDGWKAGLEAAARVAEVERYAIIRLPGGTCCVVDRTDPDAPADFCGTIAEGKTVLSEKRAAAVRALLIEDKE